MMQIKHPELHKEYQLRTKHIYRFKLFGILPLFLIEIIGYTKKIFLFNKILIMKINYGSRFR